jgi:hypothetical protein
LIDRPLHRRAARRKAGDAAPHLAVADFLAPAGGPGEADDGLDIGLERSAGKFRRGGVGRGRAGRAGAHLDGGRGAGFGRQYDSEPGAVFFGWGRARRIVLSAFAAKGRFGAIAP